MDAGLVAEELKELLRGRGIRRGSVRSWLGPNLQQVLGIGATTTDEDARVALVELIREHTARFPRDLRYLILVALGIVVDHPFLEDRLEVAEQALDRSQRVLRRRLRTGEQLLAESIVQGYGHRTPVPFDQLGWQWQDHNIHLLLREEAVLTLTRGVVALADHPKLIEEAFVLERALPEGTDLEFAALAGVRLVSVQRRGELHWTVEMELPDNLSRGRTLDTVLQIRVPFSRSLAPFLVLAPVRQVRSARMVIDFGESPETSAVWIIDGVPTSTIHNLRGTTAEVAGAVPPLFSAEFARPRPGLAYGVGWRWAD